MKAQYKIFILLLIIAAFQSLYYYPLMPETLASHFDSMGRPNGWSSKLMFFTLYLGMIILMALIFSGLPLSLTRFPLSLINLPNKEYWLSSERLSETTLIIRGKMLWFGMATVIFMICVIQLVIQTNLQRTQFFPVRIMWVILIVYCAFTLLWAIRFITRFKRVSYQ